jgi:hypothetical protein
MKIPREPRLPTPAPQRRDVTSVSARPSQRTAWFAVSVTIGPGACEGARAFGTTRWLSADAPRFPLPGCNALNCDCRYKHHSDRRAGDQRSRDRGGIPRPHSGPERRGERHGRRSTDL